MSIDERRLLVTLRRRVSLGGRVIDCGERLKPGACVTVVACAGDAGSAPEGQRVWRAKVRASGRYFFLDLPPGDFSVCVGDGSRPALAERAVQLGPAELDPKAGYALQTAFDLHVPSINAGNSDPAALASPPINVPR